MQQLRPPAGGDPRFYSPDRDVAWAFDSLARYAIEALRRENWEPDFAAWMGEAGLAEDDLRDTAVKFVRGLQTFTDPDTPRAHDGLAASGFLACPPAARYAMLARVGLVVTTFYYQSIREAEADDMPPDASGLGALEKTALEYLRPPSWRALCRTGIRKLLGS